MSSLPLLPAMSFLLLGDFMDLDQLIYEGWCAVTMGIWEAGTKLDAVVED